MPDRIKEETDNIVILDEDRIGNFIIYLLVAFGIFFIFRESFNFLLLGLLLALLFVFVGLGKLLNDESISIDKTLQSVVIKNDQDLKYIPFKDIKEIRISPTFTDVDGILVVKSWSIFLSTIDGESIKIYNAKGHSDLERVAKRIGKITGKRIPHDYSPMTGSWRHDFENMREDIESVYRS